MPLNSIEQWFKQAKPAPTSKDLATQIGCHYEEIFEMQEALGDAYGECEALADNYKTQQFYAKALQTLSDERKQELLDALADQIVTAIGIAYMADMDIQGALAEVNRSNWSKFVDGVPQFDANGKIQKPDTYSPPDLKPFLRKTDERRT